MNMNIDFFNDLLGLDITTETKQRKYVRARQCVWFFLFNLHRNALNYTQISKIFGVDRTAVSKACDNINEELSEGNDNLSKQYWAVLEPYLSSYEQ